MKSFTSACVHIIGVVLLLGIFVIIATPFIFRMVPSSVFNIFYFGNLYTLSLIGLEAGFITVWLALNELRKVFILFKDGKYFAPANAIHLKRISLLALGLAILLAAKCLVDFSVTTLIFSLFSLSTFAISRIFSKVMKVGTDLDEQNSLVI